MLLNLLGITTAYAATTAGKQGSFLSILPMLVIFVVVFYFLLVRPQSKRAKQQKQVLADLKVGDEIMTNGGIIGKIKTLKDSFMVITIAKDVDMTISKNAVASVLPKGTLNLK